MEDGVRNQVVKARIDLKVSQSGKDRDWDIFAACQTGACDCVALLLCHGVAVKSSQDHVLILSFRHHREQQYGQLAQARECEREAAGAHDWLGGELRPNGCSGLSSRLR